MIKNNFLDKEIFTKIKTVITSNELPWYAQYGLATEGDGKALFTHILVDEHQQISSSAYNVIGKPLVDKIKEVEPDFFRVLRLKINCYPNQAKPFKSSFHLDMTKSSYKTLILNINTNNGYTEFENKEIPNFLSQENSGYIFDGKEPHRSVSQTDTPYRWNINFNYEC